MGNFILANSNLIKICQLKFANQNLPIKVCKLKSAESID